MARGLAWYGGKAPDNGGGWVTSVGMNRPSTPGLAVDPEGTVPLPTRARPASAEGPRVTVSAITAPPDERTAPNGRIRLPK
ncbi:MAG: hypothetical protein ABMA64_12475 [Myxococcota bacterium]